MLEASQYADNTFVTLTYNDENLPENGVTPRELSGFMKRLRTNTGLKVRYFGVGEYGDVSWRPHYHLALFGFPRCLYGRTRQTHSDGCCSVCRSIAKAWQGRGRIESATLEKGSAGYIAGYVLKKMTAVDDYRLPPGFEPEFARMSLRPGLGLGMMHDVASVLLEHGLDETMVDVPLTLQHGRAQFPLGRYLRRKLRAMIGRDENTPLEALREYQEALQVLREDAFENSESVSKKIAEAGLGARINMEGKLAIKGRRS